MRMLPDNPSVDFLRQEAKDLLVALRESNPDASLADAQRALAEQYGFRAWTELKAEAEQRRTAVPTAEAGLAEALASTFGLGTVTSPMTPIGYEYMGRKWCLETDKGRWIAGPVFEWIDATQAERGASLREAARTVGVSSPVPVRSAQGTLVERVLAGPWRVDEWMEFGPTPVPPVRSALAAKVGDALGAIHSLAIPTDLPVTSWLTFRKPDQEWDDLLQRARAARKPFVDDLVNVYPTIERLRQVNAPVGSSLVLSICDLVPDATRMGKGDDLVLVHWDFAGAHDPAFELAYVLNQWAMYPDLNVAAARAIVTGYGARTGSVPTLTLDAFSVAISGWLNWFYNQVCECIDPESADTLEFSERELRVLLADPLTTAKLERLVEVVAPVTNG